MKNLQLIGWNNGGADLRLVYAFGNEVGLTTGNCWSSEN